MNKNSGQNAVDIFREINKTNELDRKRKKRRGEREKEREGGGGGKVHFPSRPDSHSINSERVPTLNHWRLTSSFL